MSTSTTPVHDPVQARVDAAFSNMRNAFETTRAAARRMEMELQRQPDPAKAARTLLHQLAQSHASAMLEMEAALSAIEDAHIMRRTIAEAQPR